MAEDDYLSLLKRVRESLPSKVVSHERFVVPDLDVFYEGKTTVFRNFEEVADVINRDPSQVLGYLLRELGTAGTQEGRRAVFKGRVPKSKIDDRVSSYIETYVLCSECRRPDTQLVKEGRITLLVCEACGARRPVRIRRSLARETEEKALVEGKVYEVLIKDIGKKGDGIAKKDDYIIFIPGTAKGSTVKVRVNKIVGKVAFGTVSRE